MILALASLFCLDESLLREWVYLWMAGSRAWGTAAEWINHSFLKGKPVVLRAESQSLWVLALSSVCKCGQVICISHASVSPTVSWNKTVSCFSQMCGEDEMCFCLWNHLEPRCSFLSDIILRTTENFSVHVSEDNQHSGAMKQALLGEKWLTGRKIAEWLAQDLLFMFPFLKLTLVPLLVVGLFLSDHQLWLINSTHDGIVYTLDCDDLTLGWLLSIWWPCSTFTLPWLSSCTFVSVLCQHRASMLHATE